MGPKKYEVVISGMSGNFPGCEDINDFESKLFNMADMIEEQHSWDTDYLKEVPKFIGKLKNTITLDNNFFGIHKELYNLMDPIILESLHCSFEAICDAGVNPFNLNGSNTAVLMSSFLSETELTSVLSHDVLGPGMVGQSRGMQANRISYFLNLYGPSYTVQDTWNGGMQALQDACRLISSGECAAVLVGAACTVYRPEISYRFQVMGKLNSDGKTKSFCANADGYTRSEGCVVFFLQRAEDAKRSYGTIVNVLTCNYGVRTTSYPDFSPELYKELLLRVYKEAQIDPTEVCYIEADGSASKKMDALELNCISEVMCTNRTTPLAVGSVKSNVGHTEAASSLMSIVKVLMAFKSGFIPPNLHYSSPNPDVPALLSGQMEVVTEPTPLNGNIVGVSSIGLAGSYGHAIIKQNSKIKSNLKQISSSNMPWLFIISGRNENFLRNVVERVEAMPFNEEFLRLTHTVFKSHIRGYFFRGYTLLNTNTKEEFEIKECDTGRKRPIWYLFSGMGSQWPGMGADLMRLPTFARAINNCHQVLQRKGINLLEIILSTDPHTYDSILNSFIGIAAIQIGLVDVLRELGIEPDGIIGHSVGELGCAYADGCFTAEQMILSAYFRGKASLEVPLLKGMMAAVGLGYNQIKDQLPPTIEVACHNSNISCTLSGPAEDMQQYVTSLKMKGIFAKLVNVSNIAYHSRYIKALGPVLLKYLQQIIIKPIERTKRWISSSVPESSWDSDLAKFCSAEYQTNNLLNSVLFEEASAHIPDGAIVIEIAPHGLFQAIVKKSLSNCINVPLVNRSENDSMTHLFRVIGKLYLEGINVNIDNLYPEIDFPLIGPIPSLGPLLTWDKVISTGLDKYFEKFRIYQSLAKMMISDSSLEKYYGHNINGKQVIPPALLLNIVLDKFKKLWEASTNRNSIIIENIFFNEHLEVLDNLNSELCLQIQKNSGEFDIVLNSQVIAFGQLDYQEYDDHLFLESKKNIFQEPLLKMNHDDIYKYFDEFSVKFNDNFKSIQTICFNETEMNAVIHWSGDMVLFLDALLMLISLYETMKCNDFQMIRFVRQICINFSYFDSYNFKEITISYNRITQELRCEGLKLHLPLTRRCNIKPLSSELIKNCYKFLPYYASANEKKHCGQIDDCLQTIFQNILQNKDEQKKLTAVLFPDDDGGDFYNNLLNYREQVDIITSPTKDILDELHQNHKNTDNLLLFGEVPFFKTASSCLEKLTVGFVILKDKLETEKLNNLYPILNFKFNNIKFVLYKVCYQVKLASNKIIKIDINDKWKSYLKLSLKNVKNEDLENQTSQIIYLVGRAKSLFSIHEIVRYCLSLKNSHLIRFIFLDDKLPPFSLDQPFYKKQIAMDLVMNICVNRTWGCLKLSSPTIKSSSIPLESQQKSIYSISSINGNNVSLIALGLNATDLIDNSKDEKLGVFDYCGVDRTGKTICGVGILTDGKKLIEDEILCWHKPQNWTNEEAVSIPFCYSIAYYILRKNDGSAIIKNTILVHRGGLLVSQAIIHVALSRGCEVFTTYTTVEEKHLIHQLFPQIESSNIFSCKNKSFEELLLNKTERKGVNIVVETIGDQAMVTSSLFCLSRRGHCFVLNTEFMNNVTALGMFRFLKELTVKGVPTDILLELPHYTKEMIQKDMETGIKEGHVKPLQTICLPLGILNIVATDMLNSMTGYKNKLICTKECNKKQNLDKELFICSGLKTQIIISNEFSFWLDLLNWLIRRGAMNIHIALIDLKNLDRSKLQRLMSIVNKHPAASINLLPKKKCSDLKTILPKINSQQEISHVFCLGKMAKDEINNLDIFLKDININTSLVCIGNGGEAVCELRNKNNIPGLAISCELQLMKGSIILPELDGIINYCGDENVITLSEEGGKKESNGLSKYHKRLPDDITELLSLYRKSVTRACFIEIMTMCAPLKYNKEVDPIFVIPSLRPNEMNKLTSRLFYPTFEARLPHDVDDIDTIAKDLFEDMKRFKFNVFTIIANEWGGAVGLNLAKYLENSGKLVMLILLNSSPNSVPNWASAVLQMGDDNIINKYIKLPFKVRQKLAAMSDWNEKLDFALQSSTEEVANREEIRKAINFLRKCLLSSIKCNIGNELFHGKCIVYLTKDLPQDDSIKQSFLILPVINSVDSSDHFEMLEDPEFAKKINSHIPFEHKMAAHGLKCDSLGDNIYQQNKIIPNQIEE